MRALNFRGAGKGIWWGLLLLIGLLTAAGQPVAEQPLVLRPATPSFTSPLFTIKQVRDERPGRPAVAWLLPTPPATANVARPVGLQGGTEAALRQFVTRTLPARPARYGVTLRVLECRVQETAAAGGQAAGQITVRLAFDWVNAEGRTITLTEYRGGARYLRPLPDRTVVEPTLRQTLLGGLSYFNTWLTRAATHDVRLATAVHPTARFHMAQTEADTVFYDPARPLVWSDFTGQPRSQGRYAASVFPGFAYQGRPRVVNGVVELELILKVFVVRSSSWVGPGQQTAEHLNHEQRHFDIVRLVAERFRRKATPDSLTVEDYNSILQLQYLKSFTEMNRLQEQYDAETHGSPLAQERWNRRLDEELRQYGIKK
ncbi:lytic polysaccharide monooxygenase [Hymenobacter sp. DG01]|uniref:lytic polysaccharide monooxygenase n=1 Tax=Hymenobacter sp. DG01 TaxID=2584940 RepID=UPI001122AE0C|nr:lytic polysaccharide monooxygenase [Hymenobacter sp. DG01]